MIEPVQGAFQDFWQLLLKPETSSARRHTQRVKEVRALMQTDTGALVFDKPFESVSVAEGAKSVAAVLIEPRAVAMDGPCAPCSVKVP